MDEPRPQNYQQYEENAPIELSLEEHGGELFDGDEADESVADFDAEETNPKEVSE
jgi:hypothetical protein